MNQLISSLNLPIETIKKLKMSGKLHVSDLNDLELNALPIKFYEAPYVSAINLLEQELLTYSILTFNTELDSVLKDEIVPGKITEIAGFPGSGKTQICFQLCITVQVPKSMGGLEGQVIYLNTNKNFSPGRVKELRFLLVETLKIQPENLGRLNSDEEILKNIFVFNVQTVVEILSTVTILERFLVGKNVKLLIIDSIYLPLKKIRDSMERLTFAYKLLDNLQLLAVKLKFAIVITNNFTTKIENGNVFFKPSFGDGLFERVNSRICLSKLGNSYTADVIKSVAKSPVKVNFSIF
ncbi:DNA repair protein RAD51 homolog 3 [Euwallacea similis]|uniref:DNA repair protein RAD51 homolog 3 n=1 Tax=Euwallacea similis TaxID=1736056 RepID=UPI00344F52A3